MVSLTNFASLLAIALTTSLLSNAVPDAQSQGINNIVSKQGQDGSSTPPMEGGNCDSTKDRIVCVDDKSMLICNENEWSAYANCTLGTICNDGYCVYPESSSSDNSGGAASNPQEDASQSPPSDGSDQTDAKQEVTSNAAETNQNPALSTPVAESSAVQPSLGAGSASSEVQGSGVASGASENASSGVVATAANESTDAGADESAADTANESANDSSSSGDESSGGGDSGSNYGITCESFNQAVAGASKAISQNYPTPTSAQCNAFLKGMKSQGGIASAREAAMFLANILWESDGLRAKQEYDCVQNPEQCAQTYKTPEDVPGQTYWGRGYIQLTWHYNYEDASKGLYGDNRLATDADQVATNEETAWGVSFWFWKANVRSDPGVQAGEFGASVNKINGALECKGSAQDKAKKRYAMYQAILKVFAPHETPNEKGCYN